MSHSKASSIFPFFNSENQGLKRPSVLHYVQLNVIGATSLRIANSNMLWQDILHGRQTDFQHSHFLLELVFSSKKPRCALNQTLSLYFKCYFYALYKGRDIQELLFTNTNVFIRIYVFQEGSIMSRLVLVFVLLLLAVSFLQERFEHSIIR